MLDPRIARLRAALERFVDEGALAGAYATLLARDGTTASCSVGVADPASGRRFDEGTIVRVHSMSKPLTTAAFLTLVDGGCVTLDARVDSFLPELGAMRVAHPRGPLESPTPLTIAHLLTHTSGMTYADPGGSLAERSMARATSADDCGMHGASLADWVARAATAELAHPPGEAWTYGVGIDVAGRVAELLSGEPLDVFLRRRLFEPLDMSDSGFHVPQGARARVAPVLRRDATGRFEAYELSEELPAVLSGGGGIFSTPADFRRFLAMLLADGSHGATRVLRAESVRGMRTDRTRSNGSILPRVGEVSFGAGCGFGLGGRVVIDPIAAGYGSRGTYGWDGIAGTTFFVDPTEGVAALLVTQLVPWPAELHETFRSIASGRT